MEMQQGSITDLVVAGGGCFGSHHVRQLLKAIRQGRLQAERLLVVDRNAEHRVSREFGDDPLVRMVQADWVTFLGTYLESERAPAAHLVPPCIGPHVALEWVHQALEDTLGLVEREATPVAAELGLAFQSSDRRGNLFLSHAGWICPPNCYEPDVCPAIRGPRAWTMPETVRSLARERRPDLTQALVFQARHLAYGIATIPMRELLEARERVMAQAREGRPQRVLVATVSHCHGVVGVLHVPAAEPTKRPAAGAAARAGGE